MQANFPCELCEGAVTPSPGAWEHQFLLRAPSGQAKPSHRKGTSGISTSFGASCLHLHGGDRWTDREQMFIPSSHWGWTKNSFNLLSLYSTDMPPLVCWTHKEYRARAEPPELYPTCICPWGCHVFQCGVEGNEETGFSALWRRHESIYATIFPDLSPVQMYTAEEKRENQLAVSSKFHHCLFTVLSFYHPSKEPKPCWWTAGVDGDCKVAETRF